jgi:hypothetical protein
MYDDKHILKVGQQATTHALNNQEATATCLHAAPKMDGKQHKCLSQSLH